MTTDNYLDKYLPFRIQNMISETLDSVLEDYQLKRLSQYENTKFKRMHDEILNDAGVATLDKTYEGVYKYENRDTKYAHFKENRSRSINMKKYVDSPDLTSPEQQPKVLPRTILK